MTLLITGGSGWIGSQLSKTIVEKSIFKKVIVYDILEPPEILNNKEFSKKIEFVKGDLSNKKLIDQTLVDVTHVIHLAAIADVKKCKEDPEFTRKVNVEGTENLLQCIKSSNTKRVIFASTMSAIYGKASEFNEESTPSPITEYGKQKLESEKLIQKFSATSGINSIILRKSNLYGVGITVKQNVVAAFTKQSLNDGIIKISGSGKQYRNFLNLRDCVRAYLASLTCKMSMESEIINISGTKTTSLNQLAEIIEKMVLKECGITVSKEFINNIRNDNLENEPIIYTEKAKQLLNYKPEISLEDGILELIKYFQKN